MARSKKEHEYLKDSPVFGVWYTDGAYYIFRTPELAIKAREKCDTSNAVTDLCDNFEDFTGMKLKEDEVAEVRLSVDSLKILTSPKVIL